MAIKNITPSVTAAADLFDVQASQLLLQNLEDSILLFDQQLKVVYFNRVAKEGIRNFLHLELHTGMHALDLLQPERFHLLETLYADVLRGNRHLTENNYTKPDGQVIYFENSFLPAFDDERKVKGVIVLSKNITERKKAQQIVQESETRLQFALEATRQGAWDWNLLTNEVTFSSSYQKLYGFADNELKNDVSEWITRIHPEDQEKMQFSVQEHLQSPEPIYDSRYRLRARDGSYRWVLAKGRLIRDEETGEPVRMIGTHTDITDAVDKEIQLRQYNERFHYMMKATNEMLWEWDLENNRIFRSEDGLKRVYGITDNSIIEVAEQWLLRIHPDDIEKTRTMLGEIRKATHNNTFELEYRFQRDDGGYNHIYDRGIAIGNEEGKLVRIIGSAQDISERKRLEKELLNAELEYQRLIHQATIDSQERERAEIGKELHDNINQVLTTTKLYLDLAQTNSGMREDLISKSVKNINDVIQEIRHLSRSLMDPSIGDLGLIASLNDLVENIHLTRKLEVQLTADENIEHLLDANQKLALFRIFQESLNNVLRHAQATRVTIDLTVVNDHLHAHFRDNGIGFNPGSAKKGAGLKNIQNRIYLINGTLQVESKPGEGCVIKIQFPI